MQPLEQPPLRRRLSRSLSSSCPPSRFLRARARPHTVSKSAADRDTHQNTRTHPHSQSVCVRFCPSVATSDGRRNRDSGYDESLSSLSLSSHTHTHTLTHPTPPKGTRAFSLAVCGLRSACESDSLLLLLCADSEPVSEDTDGGEDTDPETSPRVGPSVSIAPAWSKLVLSPP